MASRGSEPGISANVQIDRRDDSQPSESQVIAGAADDSGRPVTDLTAEEIIVTLLVRALPRDIEVAADHDGAATAHGALPVPDLTSTDDRTHWACFVLPLRLTKGP